MDNAGFDSVMPPGGSGYYYLVSGQNSCGEGDLGQDSQAANRPGGSVCP